jgi:hypothetical protein
MPMRQNSRGEYTREKPWHSGGIKAATIIDRAVSHLFFARSSNAGRTNSGGWTRGLMVAYGGVWEEREGARKEFLADA